jgi:formylglycine-generating enzyme required for sulfatase activity/serine/threonine protein kinase
MTEESIFLAALAIADPAERTASVDRACAGDAALRRQVEALLAAHERSGEFLDVPACEQIAACLSQPDNGTVAVEAKAEGAEIVAAREDQHNPVATQAEQHGDGEDKGLAFLQPSTKPGSLGRLGHYEVLEVLGQGGFGIVVKAFDEMLHRVVAIKVMSMQLAATSPARKRFLREARSAAAIRHENVVDIHAVEEQPIPYLVMEYVAGETLQQKLDRVGPLDVPEVLRIGQQVAGGLAAAHDLGLVHRDIKPSNILLENGVEPRVKITDFGLARAADDASLTQSGLIAGTPMYMAPEQAQGEAIDQRADLFSLGSVLYVMCSGRPPFRASTTLAVLKRVAEDTPRPIQEIIPEVPEWLCAIVARLHAKKPEARFASAKEVAELLAGHLAELHQHGSVQPLLNVPRTATELAPAVRKPVSSARPQARETPESGSPPDPQLLFGLWGARTNGKPRPRSPVLLAVAMALILGLIGFLLLQGFWPPRGELPPVPKAPPVVFRVEANQVWQDTGVDVVEGQVVVLDPQGTWRKGQQTCSAGGLERAAKERAVWTEGAPLLCLLARVGDEPAPTPVRQREFFKPKRSGRLFVQANDLDLEGNNDGLQLTITGGLRLGDAAPPPGLTAVQAADRDWQPLLARTEAPGVKPEQVREEVFDYCQKYAGTFQAFRAGLLLRKLPLVNSIGMKLAPIPPGKFLMGSPDDEAGREAHEGPQHEVVITRPFYIGVYNVTVGQFKAFVKEKGYQTEAETSGGAYRLFPDGDWKNDPEANWQNPGFEQTDDHPVVCVSWYDAKAFCDWLSDKEGKQYALPTEARWEHSCRAGSRTKFSFGDDDQELVQYAWYNANAQMKTHPVGQKKPNAWGLYDMHGNVWQWTADWYGGDYYQKSPKEDPPGPSAGGSRVLRGGDWYGVAGDCRAARRRGLHAPSGRNTHIGFRVVLLR